MEVALFRLSGSGGQMFLEAIIDWATTQRSVYQVTCWLTERPIKSNEEEAKRLRPLETSDQNFQLEKTPKLSNCDVLLRGGERPGQAIKKHKQCYIRELICQCAALCYFGLTKMGWRQHFFQYQISNKTSVFFGASELFTTPNVRITLPYNYPHWIFTQTFRLSTCNINSSGSLTPISWPRSSRLVVFKLF